MRRSLLMAAVVGALVAVPAAAIAANPFADVPEGQYYSEPVGWAYTNGITTGTSATTFSPDAAVTRGQVVTFLQRYHQNLVGPAAIGDAAEALGCGGDEVIYDQDGDWACGTPAVVDGLGPFEHHRLTTGGTGGEFDLVLGATDNPFIAHFDAATLDTISLHCNDPLCASANPVRVTTDGATNAGGSVVLNGAGRPRIAVRDETFTGLGLMLCGDLRCSTGTLLPLDGGGADEVGFDAEVAHNRLGYPIVAHRNGDAFELHVCLSSSCFVSTSRQPGLGATNPEVALVTPTGEAPILVYGAAAGGLRAYVCADDTCSSGTDHELVAGVQTLGIDAAIDSDGNPVIVYSNANGDELGLYRCTADDCSTGVGSPLDVAAGTEHVSIALGGDDAPLLTAIDANGTATAITCADAGCSSSAEHAITNLAADAGVVAHPDGSIVVVYLDTATGDLFAAAADHGPHVAFD